MGREGDTPDVRARGEETAASSADAGRTGARPKAKTGDTSLVLPYPLVVLGTTREAEIGRPLGDLLRRIGCL